MKLTPVNVSKSVLTKLVNLLLARDKAFSFVKFWIAARGNCSRLQSVM